MVDVRGGVDDPRAVVPRATDTVEDALAAVRPIVRDVAERGAAAVLDWCERLDGVRPASLRVPNDSLAAALSGLDPTVREALEDSIDRVRTVHADQVPPSFTTDVVPGGTVTQRWIPVDRVGLYVPGGRAAYPSSVVMNVVPAQTAGVGSIAVASPPRPDNSGRPHPTILAACALLEVDEVYAVGGAQAVAMFAYGVDPGDGTGCRPVNVITGPGNVYVAAAKRLVLGKVGIDSEAGPTEVMVIADASANPSCIAADLISQAEHDPMAAAVLVTDSPELAEAVIGELMRRVPVAKHRERIMTALAGPQSAVLLVADIATAVTIANAYAAEHLEIHTATARQDAARIRNAGAIFIGGDSPVSLGDYAAGSNHVLPTRGTAAYASGLGVHAFLRGVQVIDFDRGALARVADTVRTLATAEDLPAHSAAIAARFSGEATP